MDETIFSPKTSRVLLIGVKCLRFSAARALKENRRGFPATLESARLVNNQRQSIVSSHAETIARSRNQCQGEMSKQRSCLDNRLHVRSLCTGCRLRAIFRQVAVNTQRNRIMDRLF